MQYLLSRPYLLAGERAQLKDKEAHIILQDRISLEAMSPARFSHAEPLRSTSIDKRAGLWSSPSSKTRRDSSLSKSSIPLLVITDRRQIAQNTPAVHRVAIREYRDQPARRERFLQTHETQANATDLFLSPQTADYSGHPKKRLQTRDFQELPPRPSGAACRV